MNEQLWLTFILLYFPCLFFWCGLEGACDASPKVYRFFIRGENWLEEISPNNIVAWLILIANIPGMIFYFLICYHFHKLELKNKMLEELER